MKQGIIFALLAIVVIAGGIYYSRHMQKKVSQAPGGISAQNTNQNQPNQPTINTTLYKSETELATAASTTPITESTLTDGLKIQEVQTGTGPAAQLGSMVTVNYIGTLADGSKFDASFFHGPGFQFNLGAGQVIQGWDEGVIGMQVGGIRKLVIPPALGYGAVSPGPGIPANATLYFTIQLLKIGS